MDYFGDIEVAIGAVRNHRLAWLEMELRAIEIYRDMSGSNDTRLEMRWTSG